MFQKVGLIAERYEAIKESLMDPSVVSDNQKYASLMREYKNISPIVEKYEEYTRCIKSFASLESAGQISAGSAYGGDDLFSSLLGGWAIRLTSPIWCCTFVPIWPDLSRGKTSASTAV